MSEEHPLDDATVEELLSGRYTGGAKDLAVLAQAIEAVRGLADGPAPAPNRALQRVLEGERPPVDDPWLARPIAPAGAPEPPPRRPAFRWAPVAALAAGIAAVGITGAASAGVLPDPAQRLVATVVRTVTPFEVPEPTSDAQGPRSGIPGPRTDAPSAGAPSEPGTGRVAPGTTAVPTTLGRTQLPPGSTPTSRPAGAGNQLEPGPPTSANPRTGGPVPSTPARPDLIASLMGAGSGTASLTLDVGQNRLCLQLTLTGVGPATVVHVHGGASGTVGPAVATVAPPFDPNVPSCVSVERSVLTELRAHPEDHYIDVHNAEFPDGAARGQVRRP